MYDSHARIVGNTILQGYYDANPPPSATVDTSLLFSEQELTYANALFTKEPRERDFATEFDKFVYRHMPRFQPQRDFQD